MSVRASLGVVLLALLVVLIMAWASACQLTFGPAMLPVLISVVAWVSLRFLASR